jgi:large subunit ribosomal protein L35
MKTKKAVAAKFKVTGTGKLLRRKPGKRHLLSGKSSKRKRHLGKPALVFESVAHTYKKMMCV